MTLQEITNHLLSLADSERAARSAGYFKTGPGEYGNGDKFLGIRAPVIRQAVRQYRDASPSTAAKLLKSEYHEIRLFALLLLVSHFKHANAAGQEKIYHLYLANTRHINNWDLVDSSAPYIVGAYLQDKDRSILYQLSASPSLWERRIAVMSTFWFIRDGQFDYSLRIAEQLLTDPEDLIHKAVGWMLREIGNRNKATEVTFLKTNHRHMPRTMLRYAIEKFGEKERRRYLSRERREQ